MASKKTLTQDNLEALGAARLAALLVVVSDGNTAVKRRLRLELAGAESPAALAKEIRKRLATIGRSRAFVEWQNMKALADDLTAQRRAIVEQVAKPMPAEGLELMWRFMDLASAVMGRCDDSNGLISGVFHTAVGELGDIAQAAKPDPTQLAEHVFGALTHNDYGQFDRLIQTLQQALGPVGLDHLKQRMIALSAEPVRKLPANQRRVIGWGAGGALYADEIENHARASTVRLALQAIADAQGDVDAYIAQYDAKVRQVPNIAAGIARRLLAAGRIDEASQTLEAAKPQHEGGPRDEWDDARIEVLDALGRGDAAQAARWSCFERSLSVRHLRDHLKRLPDFEDFDAEQRAMAYVERYRNVMHAVWFLMSWPALDRVARAVMQRAAELDGNRYEVLTPAAEALAAKYPLAATLMLRAMIDFTLTQARSSRYGHAARHLRDCAGLAQAITAYGAFETHDAYVARLRREHGRKAAFWAAVA